MKSYLTGNPTLNMNLNIDTYFDDYNFHECANYKDFEFTSINKEAIEVMV